LPGRPGACTDTLSQSDISGVSVLYTDSGNTPHTAGATYSSGDNSTSLRYSVTLPSVVANSLFMVSSNTLSVSVTPNPSRTSVAYNGGAGIKAGPYLGAGTLTYHTSWTIAATGNLNPKYAEYATDVVTLTATRDDHGNMNGAGTLGGHFAEDGSASTPSTTGVAAITLQNLLLASNWQQSFYTLTADVGTAGNTSSVLKPTPTLGSWVITANQQALPDPVFTFNDTNSNGILDKSSSGSSDKVNIDYNLGIIDPNLVSMTSTVPSPLTGSLKAGQTTFNITNP